MSLEQAQLAAELALDAGAEVRVIAQGSNGTVLASDAAACVAKVVSYDAEGAQYWAKHEKLMHMVVNKSKSGRFLKLEKATEYKKQAMVLVVEKADQTFEDLVQTNGALTKEQVEQYSKEVIAAVEELHRLKLAHRDIKPGNVFLKGDAVKLGDFGSAFKLDKYGFVGTDPCQEQRAACASAGWTEADGQIWGGMTLAYCAPEVLRGEEYGAGSDLWAVACVMYHLICGEACWFGLSTEAMYAKILAGATPLDDAAFKAKLATQTAWTRETVARLFAVDAAQRTALPAVAAMPFF